MAEPGFWDDGTAAQKLINENNELKNKFDNFHQLSQSIDDLDVLFELVQEDETDAELRAELETQLDDTQAQLEKYQLSLLLNGKYDKDNAILEIHPGAGGTESQDWGSMLMRMYMRWQNSITLRLKLRTIKLVKKPELKV